MFFRVTLPKLYNQINRIFLKCYLKSSYLIIYKYYIALWRWKYILGCLIYKSSIICSLDCFLLNTSLFSTQLLEHILKILINNKLKLNWWKSWYMRLQVIFNFKNVNYWDRLAIWSNQQVFILILSLIYFCNLFK